MHIRVSSPAHQLKPGELDRIHKDLEKIDRRLQDYRAEVIAEVRINPSDNGRPGFHVSLELDYGRNHLRATAEHTDLGRALRSGREDILRQINDRSRRGHSSFSKRT
jgi:ribosome-associated translation inhibitor RaiA